MALGAIALAAGLSGCVETTGSYVGDGYNRNVLIVNQTGQTIWRFYGSNSGSNYWEEDLLGSSVLPSGQSIMVDFTDGSGYCNFDFKFEFQNGQSIQDFGINVCSIGTYYVR
ncbi:MAG: hypothetical protein IT542_12120 [Rubellimicrobium sp.]|nr:hypothetical protein [Rubellimicrobium sp.]